MKVKTGNEPCTVAAAPPSLRGGTGAEAWSEGGRGAGESRPRGRPRQPPARRRWSPREKRCQDVRREDAGARHGDRVAGRFVWVQPPRRSEAAVRVSARGTRADDRSRLSTSFPELSWGSDPLSAGIPLRAAAPTRPCVPAACSQGLAGARAAPGKPSRSRISLCVLRSRLIITFFQRESKGTLETHVQQMNQL